MAMSLLLGNYTGDEATIKKKGIDWAQTEKKCVPYEGVSFNNDAALVTDYSAGDEAYNYARVISEGTTKYYYIRNRIMSIGGKIIYLLDCDVLYTYQTDIYKCPCVCRRAGSLEGTPNNNQDPYIYDGQMQTRAYKEVDLYVTEKPPASFNYDNASYVIVTAG